MLAPRNINWDALLSPAGPSVGATRILTLGSASKPNGRLKAVVVESRGALLSQAKHAPCD
jgi:hypothetical protein